MIPGSATPFLLAKSDGDYKIERSLRFNSGDSAKLTRSVSIPGNQKTWTWSAWVKRASLAASDQYLFGAQGNGQFFILGFVSTHEFFINPSAGVTGATLKSNAKFRDTSAWYHIVVAVDTTQSTASNRVKVYINGDQITSWATSTYPNQNTEWHVNNNVSHSIGASTQSTGYSNVYMTEVHHVDGTQLAATDFGEYDDDGVWQPIKYSGSYGPSRSVNQTATWSSSTGYVDSDNPSGKSSANIFDGNLTTYVSGRPSSTEVTLANSITASSSIRFYGAWEDTNSRWAVNGTATNAQPLTYTNNYTFGWSEPTNLTFPLTITSVGVLNASAGAGGRFVAVEVDGALLVDPGINVAPNNGFKLNFSDGSTESALGTDSSGNGNDWTVNNLTPSTQADYSNGFDVVTYTGNGTTQSITGLSFQPDLVWIKQRSTARNHQIIDSVRGATKDLRSNTNGVETTTSTGLTSFNSDGFTLGGDAGYNQNLGTYVAWCWKAGGTPSNNTDGTITTSVSVDTTYGFSVATWQTAAAQGTIGTGLSKVDFAIIKTTTVSGNWYVWSKAYPDSSQNLILNSQAGISTSSDIFNGGGAAGGGLLALGSLGNPNAGMVAYCWQEIAGFSKFGSTVVPSSGTQFVDVGFKPRFLIIKRGDASGYSSWALIDSERGTTYDNILWADRTDAQGKRGNGTNAGTYLNVTFSDTGFTYSAGHAEFGQPGTTNYYFAFADTPPASFIDNLIDTPTDYEAGSGNNGGNYATLNPLAANSDVALSDGNLKFTKSGNSWDNARSTIGMSSGKWYCEIKIATGTYCHCGILKDATGSDQFVGQDATSWGYSQDGGKYNNSVRTVPYGDTLTTGDVIGIAFDADSGNLYFYKNGVAQNSGNAAYTGLTDGPYFFATSAYGSTEHIFNAGQRPFAYTPRSGHKSLCTTNLADPTITDGKTAMNTSLYTGNGSTNAITGVGHSPDILWIKSRSNATFGAIADTVTGPNYFLRTNGTNALSGPGYNDDIVSFDSDGFTLGADTYYAFCNQNTYTYAAWTWDAGSSNTTVAADANGSGLPGAACEYRVNPSTGCSVVKVANPTSTETRVHGLNKKPDLIICKSTGSTDSWHTYHSSLGYTKYINLNGSGGAASSDQFGSQEPTSTYFYVKANTGSGANKADGMIYYIWTAVEGYSAFGSYTGNGSSDGTFVALSFRPAFLLLKRSDGSANWLIYDNKREGYNFNNDPLYANLGDAEGTTDYIDLLSNGFKIRNTHGSINASGGTYIYAAFAEHPFKTARAR